MKTPVSEHPVVVIGGGFVGLTIAYELAKAGVPVTVLEKDREPGGIAAGFDLEGLRLDRFYHYWYVDTASTTTGTWTTPTWPPSSARSAPRTKWSSIAPAPTSSTTENSTA